MPPSRLLDLLDRPIAFQRPFVDLTGSITAALMLSQALYWSRRTKDPSGWFYKSQAEWHEETGLTRREQELARKRLRQLPFWQEQLRGIPATLHFRLDAQALEDVLLERKEPTWTADMIIDNDATYLRNLAKSAYMRWMQAGLVAEHVDYIKVLSTARQD
jgi:hypothetical protein